MKVLGVIPARGGSKGIPLKNIKKLCGKPLIAYTIESAKEAGSITRLVVSTDSDKIANVAESFQMEVIYRPREFATDDAPTELALIHALDELKGYDGFDPDIVLTLEPTSPFRSALTINSCLKIFQKSDADSVIGVVETRACYGKIIDDKFEFLFKDQPRRRQDREPLYRESSTIYGTRREVLRRKQSVLGDNLYPLIIPEQEALDINCRFDFELAEILMNKKLVGEG